jgi:hypothetical protein
MFRPASLVIAGLLCLALAPLLADEAEDTVGKACANERTKAAASPTKALVVAGAGKVFIESVPASAAHTVPVVAGEGVSLRAAPPVQVILPLAVTGGGPGADRPGVGVERNRPGPVGEPAGPRPPGDRERPRPPGRPDGGPRPGRGGRFLDDVKARINASDEEWKVIGPKIRNIVLLRQMVEGDPDAGFGPPSGGSPEPGRPGRDVGPRRAGFGWPPPGSPRGPGSAGSGGADVAPLIQAQADLQAALDDPQTSDDEVRERLAALRKALQKARADLAAATKDLLELLTADQEAVLVSLGHLD